MSKRRSEKLEEAYTKQEKALRKLAEIEQQIFDLEGSYLEGASLKVRGQRARVPPTWATDQLVRRGTGMGQWACTQGVEARLPACTSKTQVLRRGMSVLTIRSDKAAVRSRCRPAARGPAAGSHFFAFVQFGESLSHWRAQIHSHPHPRSQLHSLSHRAVAAHRRRLNSQPISDVM